MLVKGVSGVGPVYIRKPTFFFIAYVDGLPNVAKPSAVTVPTYTMLGLQSLLWSFLISIHSTDDVMAGQISRNLAALRVLNQTKCWPDNNIVDELSHTPIVSRRYDYHRKKA